MEGLDWDLLLQEHHDDFGTSDGQQVDKGLPALVTGAVTSCDVHPTGPAAAACSSGSHQQKHSQLEQSLICQYLARSQGVFPQPGIPSCPAALHDAQLTESDAEVCAHPSFISHLPLQPHDISCDL
ncbi:hypothetical protein CEUSTIGMA_g8107.t1 [Chlamydomonas eustigma]|uniref:Uncharacterized protein n=1 Tax=Chlamydomonas eustigma TaxID=1157962 RepID=A0A250XCQ6_9CHLO|nr:hypothetical protein CEUSTIGMA_g8107.t1 [Chlamydomonas eustigma]|eukprot:GAX80672.1 hypothetical protein CEUSTIGMA_g8107.t1 [Chlamydomonas eustigma]